MGLFDQCVVSCVGKLWSGGGERVEWACCNERKAGAGFELGLWASVECVSFVDSGGGIVSCGVGGRVVCPVRLEGHRSHSCCDAL